MNDHSPSTPAPQHPITRNLGELLLALGAVLFGLLVIWQTTQIRVAPIYSTVGPRVIPYIVGAGLVLTGLWLAIEALTGRTTAGSAESEDVDLSLPTDWRCIGLLTLALLAYLLLIERAGFVIASAVLFVGAAYAMGSRRYVRDIVIGVLLALALYVLFNRGLGLDLPAGVLEGIV
jgi:putative tricarboxylic transport membrane protein